MANPVIKGELEFRTQEDKRGLEKNKRKNNKATFNGSNIVNDAKLTVCGASGAKWEGTVKKNGDAWKCNDLVYLGTICIDDDVATEAPDDVNPPFSPENVTTTVTNPNGDKSQPTPPQEVEIP